jgi:hypothetical protein
MPQAVPIDPAKLLEAARDFADHQTAQGRPRPVWLRRAISSAYYALFHSISIAASEHLLPDGTRGERLELARSFDHRPLKDVCDWIARRSTAPPHARRLVESLRDTGIEDLAAAFIDLQKARHDADYDHLAVVRKATAFAAILDAAEAIDGLDAASRHDRQAFFALAALRTTLR